MYFYSDLTWSLIFHERRFVIYFGFCSDESDHEQAEEAVPDYDIDYDKQKGEVTSSADSLVHDESYQLSTDEESKKEQVEDDRQSQDRNQLRVSGEEVRGGQSHGRSQVMRGVLSRGRSQVMRGVFSRGRSQVMRGVFSRGRSRVMRGVQSRGRSRVMRGVQSRGRSRVMRRVQSRGRSRVMRGVQSRGRPQSPESAHQGADGDDEHEETSDSSESK